MRLYSQQPSTSNTVSINEKNRTLKFQILSSPVKYSPNNLSEYYWYKGNEIHTSMGGYDGTLLHGSFTSYFLNNDLMEKGTFTKGTKSGEWKKWHDNGNLSEIAHYKNGILHGELTRFNSKGQKVLLAQYKDGLLDGEMTSFDGEKVLRSRSYVKGEEVILSNEDGGNAAEQSSKKSFFNFRFKKEK